MNFNFPVLVTDAQCSSTTSLQSNPTLAFPPSPCPSGYSTSESGRSSALPFLPILNPLHHHPSPPPPLATSASQMSSTDTDSDTGRELRRLAAAPLPLPPRDGSTPATHHVRRRYVPRNKQPHSHLCNITNSSFHQQQQQLHDESRRVGHHDGVSDHQQRPPANGSSHHHTNYKGMVRNLPSPFGGMRRRRAGHHYNQQLEKGGGSKGGSRRADRLPPGRPLLCGISGIPSRDGTDGDGTDSTVSPSPRSPRAHYPHHSHASWRNNNTTFCPIRQILPPVQFAVFH